MDNRMNLVRLIFYFVALETFCLAAPTPKWQQLDSSSSEKKVDQCISCHRDQEDKPALAYLNDVHYKKGISCADCHGGDRFAEEQDAGMNPAKGYIGKPKITDIPQMCGRCHGNTERMKGFGSSLPTTMVKEYLGSVHGEKLSTGDTDIAQCVTCHGIHNIKSVKDPSSPVYPTNIPKLCASCHGNAAYMKKYNPSLPVDQYQKYLTSVHGKLNARGDAKVATCVSCHNAHEIISSKFPKSSVYPLNVPETCNRCHGDGTYMKAYHIPTDQFEKYKASVHGKTLLEKKDVSAPACNSCHGNHGAAPPGVASISNVCGTCHSLNADLFSQSPHKTAFEKKNLPQCETCHGNHGVQPVSVAMLGVGKQAVCARCHSSNDKSKGFLVAAAMRSLTDSLMQEQDRARVALDEAERKGMEVEQAKFALKDVRQALIESQTTAHAADLEKFKAVVEKGMEIATNSKTEGEAAIHEYYFRRIGLGVATLIISLLTLTLYLKLKTKERMEQ